MGKVELVFVPLPGLSHLVATVEIAKLITHRDDRISATVLLMKLPFTDSTHSTQVQSLAASISSSPISLVNLPSVEVSLESSSSSASFFTDLIKAHVPVVRDAVAELVGSDSVRLAGLVIDMFCTPMIDVADEFGLPSYLFITSGAGFLGLLLHLQSLHDDEGVDVAESKGSDAELEVPVFMNAVPWKVFPQVILDRESGGTDMFLYHVRRFRRVNGILVNTFLELESHAVNSFCNNGAPPMYPVGPILNTQVGSGRADEDVYNIIPWLDEQPPLSVVFLCFGSLGSFGLNQVKEIAEGLERSGHRFLWSLRKPPPEGKMGFPSDYVNVDEVLPTDFLDRTRQLGKVIGWAPQMAILAHPAIGGFVSHCGWNSILETIWHGVPVAATPMHAEQHLNAFQMVRDLGLAVEIKLDDHDVYGNIVSAQEIERGVRCVMNDDNELRKKVREMKEICRRVQLDGGSSHSYLGLFIKDMMAKIL